MIIFYIFADSANFRFIKILFFLNTSPNPQKKRKKDFKVVGIVISIEGYHLKNIKKIPFYIDKKIFKKFSRQNWTHFQEIFENTEILNVFSFDQSPNMTLEVKGCFRKLINV